MAKEYSRQSFTKTVNGQERTIRCYTTKTRNGWCQHTIMWYGEKLFEGRASYVNRPWESFEYETALTNLINKLPKADRDAYMKAFVEDYGKQVHDESKKQVERFKKLHDSLSDSAKEFFAEHTPTIETEQQAETVMGLMALASVMGM